MNRRPSEESKQKNREAHLGKKASEETKTKMSKTRIGMKQSEETIRKRVEAIKGEKNRGWKGDNVSYKGLHLWMRRNFVSPELCHMCKQKHPTDLANITGIYNREFKNWAYFCRKCHQLFDNIALRRHIKK